MKDNHFAKNGWERDDASGSRRSAKLPSLRRGIYAGSSPNLLATLEASRATTSNPSLRSREREEDRAGAGLEERACLSQSNLKSCSNLNASGGGGGGGGGGSMSRSQSGSIPRLNSLRPSSNLRGGGGSRQASPSSPGSSSSENSPSRKNRVRFQDMAPSPPSPLRESSKKTPSLLRSNTVANLKILDMDHQMSRMADPLLNRFYHTNGPIPSTPTHYPLSHKPIRNEPSESKLEAKTAGSMLRMYHPDTVETLSSSFGGSSGQTSSSMRALNGVVVVDKARNALTEQAERAPHSSLLRQAAAEDQKHPDTNPVQPHNNPLRVKRESGSRRSLDGVEQRPAMHSQETVDSFQTKHAWYMKPWQFTNDDQGTRIQRGPEVTDFELHFEIGEGLTSKVYLAKIKGAKLLAPTKDDKVVLKAMAKDGVLRDKTLVKDMAEDEVNMLSDVQTSRHVIRLMGTFESPAHIYVVMEWAPCDFFQLMTDHFGSHRYWCNVRIYAGQVLLALEDLHKKELMYRDLKPENLLVCVDGSVKLSDLGLATRFPKNDERVSRVCGTPEYMSPEMLTQSNGSGYTYMTDIWSYGIFIYELLTSSTPFCPIEGDNSTENSTFNQIRRHTSIDLPDELDLTDEAKDLILRLLVRNPSNRLGAQDAPGEYKSIRRANWFSSLNWNALEKGLNTPSIFPRANRALFKPVRVPPN